MTAWDGFVYNFLTMGVIFPWVYLQGPAAFPRANVEIAIIVALAAQLPIAFAYSSLATILPISGGDYIFQTRAFGKLGLIAVFSGFVVWILQWIAISGWLFTNLGLSPLFLSLGVLLGKPKLCAWALEIQHPLGLCCVSLGLAVIAIVLLSHGLRHYVRLQKYLFISTLTAVAAVVVVFHLHHDSFAQNIDSYVNVLARYYPTQVPSVGRFGATSFMEFLSKDVSGPYHLAQSTSLLQTLAIVPIAWTSLQWSTYSVEQNTEIRSADRYSTQLFMLVLSPVAAAACMLALIHSEHTASSLALLRDFSAAYSGHASPQTVDFVNHFLPPYPNVLAMIVSGSLPAVVIIALGFIANSFQITCNSLIGVSRIFVAMSADGVLPSRLKLESVEETSHAPRRALWLYFICSIPVIIANSFSPDWSAGCTIGVTVGCGFVFALSSLAAVRIPTRLRSFWLCSDLSRLPVWLIKAVGYLGALLGFSMTLPYLFLRQLWPTEVRTVYWSGITMFVVTLVCVSCSLLYDHIAKKRPGVLKAIRNIPREVRNLYE